MIAALKKNPFIAIEKNNYYYRNALYNGRLVPLASTTDEIARNRKGLKMTLLNKKEKNIIYAKKDENLTLEEISDLQETNDFEEGFGRPRYKEIIDEDGYISHEYID